MLGFYRCQIVCVDFFNGKPIVLQMLAPIAAAASSRRFVNSYCWQVSCWLASSGSITSSQDQNQKSENKKFFHQGYLRSLMMIKFIILGLILH